MTTATRERPQYVSREEAEVLKARLDLRLRLPGPRSLVPTVPSAVQMATDAGLPPDPWQAAVLTSQVPRLLLNCSRQSGKSTTTATLALWTAFYQAPALVLLLSPGLRQSGELMRKVLDTYRALGRPLHADAESALRLELPNGSRLVALPGTEATVRGYSGVKLLVIDEASQVPDGLYYALRPMLAVSGGRLIALSTPFGKRGWWYEAWANGGAEWQRVHIRADQCPRISADFLASERLSLPPPIYRQEYEGSFEEIDGSVFQAEHILAALDADLPPLFGAPR
jgi:hypothetical protein